MTQSPWPDDLMHAIEDTPEVQELIDKCDMLTDKMTQIGAIAADGLGKVMLPSEAQQACALLHAADQERKEVGYLPEGNIEEAVIHGSSAHRRSWRDRVITERLSHSGAEIV